MKSTNIRCNLRYVNTSMRAALTFLWRIQRTSSSLIYINTGPRQILRTCIFTYWSWNIWINVSPLLLEICRHLDARHTPHLMPHALHMCRFTQCHHWYPSKPMLLQSLHIEADIFKSTYLRCNWIYVDNLMHIILLIFCRIQSTPVGLLSINTSPRQILYYCSFKLKYSIQRIPAAICDM